MRLQLRQHARSEAADLLHEHLVGHGAAIEADLHHVGAGAFGRGNDALGHLFRRSPWQLLGLSFDVGALYPLKLTTSVRITPDTCPYPNVNPLTAPKERPHQQTAAKR